MVYTRVVCFLCLLDHAEVGVGGANLIASHFEHMVHVLSCNSLKVLLTTYHVCTGLWDAAQLDMDVLASPTSKLSA